MDKKRSGGFFKVTQLEINHLMSGEIGHFTIDQLLSFLDKTGRKVKLEVLANLEEPALILF